MIINKQIRTIFVLVFIFVFITSDISYAAMRESIRFNNLTIEDGLSQSTVDIMYQDSRGYIWIGTNDGLDRYNGNEFKHYKNDKYDKNSIGSNYIIDIREDNNGDIWAATLEGISRINPEKDEIKNYVSKENSGNLSNNNMCQILVTKDNRIFAATVDGLNLYDEENDSFIRILDDENILPSQYIHTVKEDSRGFIWIGTDKGLVEFDKDLNVVNSYEDAVGDSDVYNTYEDLKGNIWVCTLDNGLFRINLNDDSVNNYKNDENKSSIPSNTVKDALLDSKGKLWIATDGGLCSFDYNDETFERYKKESFEKDSILNDKTRCLLRDRNGLMWVGAYSGISVFNPDGNFHHFKAKPNDENSLSGSNINGIYMDNDKTLWIGTSENGLNAVNGDIVQYYNKANGSLLSDTINDITGLNDYVFIGTNEGLSVVHKTDDKKYDITNYTEEDGLPSKKIRALYVDSKGYLWIGTYKGLAVFDADKKEIKDITYIFDKIGVSDKFVRAIYEDSKGNYYIGCFFDGGLIKIDPEIREYKRYVNEENNISSISNNTIRYINEDLDGNILVGTSHGLNILDTNTDTFRHYTESDGLVNNTVYGILVDKNNDVWMSTNGGISKFSIKEGTFKNFTVSDGLQSNEFNGRACFKSKDGELYFGGINGFNVIDVDNVELSVFKPKVIFDSFEVNGISTGNIYNRKFKSSENNIKINFFTDDYKNTNKTKYYYRLNGTEDNWNVTDNNSIIFAHLSPGDYDLEIKTVSQQGIASEISSVKFTIQPPVWKSKYAVFVYCILLIYLIYRYLNKVKKLDKLVHKRTSELREEMEKNEKLFNQVLQLEQNKNNYFVNLSHELRTPLNVLSSLNQLIKSFSESGTSISGEKLIYYMDVMNRNCNRLLGLINNLIDYAKIENNNYVLNKEKNDIVYLTEETVLEMKDYIEEKGIELIFDTDVEEKSIECDKVDIERCIINLVSNAVKFTPSGGLIEVTVQDLDDKVRISVKDNGIGIKEENQKIIFDRFNQVIDKNSEQKGGSGLGLTITRQIINMHGGEIFVNSKDGCGSEFVIILPVE